MALAFISLFGLYFSGMSLGLMLSRWFGSVAKAVISVPIAIIPQIVFSKFVLPENTLHGAAVKIEKLMVVKWGFEALTKCKKDAIAFGDYTLSMIILFGLGVLFLILTIS